MLSYPAQFTPEGNGFVVTFPDIPEAITDGDSETEAMEYAADAIVTAFTEYIKRRRAIPPASKARGKDMRTVLLPALEEAKIRLYEAMREAGVRKADLARRMGWQKSQVDRLLDLAAPLSPGLHRDGPGKAAQAPGGERRGCATPAAQSGVGHATQRPAHVSVHRSATIVTTMVVLAGDRSTQEKGTFPLCANAGHSFFAVAAANRPSRHIDPCTRI